MITWLGCGSNFQQWLFSLTANGDVWSTKSVPRLDHCPLLFVGWEWSQRVAKQHKFLNEMPLLWANFVQIWRSLRQSLPPLGSCPSLRFNSKGCWWFGCRMGCYVVWHRYRCGCSMVPGSSSLDVEHHAFLMRKLPNFADAHLGPWILILQETFFFKILPPICSNVSFKKVFVSWFLKRCPFQLSKPKVQSKLGSRKN